MSTLSPISVVVIGLNVADHLDQCLSAIEASRYPDNLLEVIYVDSGSRDGSLEIAKRHKDVRILELNTENPSAAMGRNAGLHAASHDLIQFVDADSHLHPDWLRTAVTTLQGAVAAVAGSLHERRPNRNLYHRMAHLEWNLRKGESGWTTQEQEARVFGGNVLARRQVWLDLQGYDEDLPAGEDPDLSYRVRQAGYRILRLNAPMATHDIDIAGFGRWWKRARRSGFAYASLALRYWNQPERYMLKRVIRIVGGVGFPWMLILLGVLLGYPLPGIALALLVMLRLLFQAPHFAKVLGIPLTSAFVYSLYLALSIYPQFLGVWDVIRKQFRNWKPFTRTGHSWQNPSNAPLNLSPSTFKK